jgi:hypothetical protein
MKRKQILVIIIVIVLISSICSFYYITSLPSHQTDDQHDENGNNNDNGENDTYNFKPPTGVKREPILSYQGGSNPSEQRIWPMFQHDLQHTSYISESGSGNIGNYGLLYHRWQDAYSQPVVADFDNDGRYEILSYSEGDQDNQTGFGYFQGIKLHAFDGEVLWNFKDYPGDVWASPAIADINNDGELEIIVPLRTGSAILVLDRHGNRMWQFNVSGYVESSPAIADINLDGNMEIVFGTSGYYDSSDVVYALTVDGNTPEILWEFQPEEVEGSSPSVLSSPALVDISGDDKLEIIFGSLNGYLYALDSDGELLWKFLAETPREANENWHETVYAAPTIGDLDGDGTYEIIIQTFTSREYKNRTSIFCISSNGKEIWRLPTVYSGEGSASVADLNDDGWLEILIGTESGNLFALKPNKEVLWQINMGEPISSSPTIADLDGDGDLEVIVVTSSLTPDITNCNVTILDKNGNQLWRFLVEGESWTNIPVVDLNQDGKFELIVGVFASYPPGQIDIAYRLRAKYGLYVLGDLSSEDLIDPLPDVAIKVPMIEINPKPGITTIKVTVANAGLVEASQVEVEVRNNLITIGSDVIESIPPLSQKEVEISWAGHASGYTIVVDPNNKIIEGDEENNQATKSIT